MFTNRKSNKRFSFLWMYQIGWKSLHMWFSSKQAWHRWLKKIANRCSENCLKILALLRSIARANTVSDCEKVINSSKESRYWLKNANLREYISKYWLNIKKVFLLFLIGKLFVGKIFRCLQIGSRVEINSTKEKFYTLSVKTNSHPSLFEVFTHENNFSKKKIFLTSTKRNFFLENFFL